MRGLPVVAGIALGLALGASRAPADVIAHVPNPCPEGEYRDLSAALPDCKPLVKPSWGFDRDRFLSEWSAQGCGSQVVSVDACSEADLQAKLAGGCRIVEIPALCDFTLAAKQEVEGLTILRGVGGRPTLRLVGAEEGLEIQDRQHVVVQDLDLVGAGVLEEKPLLVWYSDNVLVERVSVVGAGHTAITMRRGQRYTGRYSEVSGTVEFHAFGTKDCAPVDPAVPDETECPALVGTSTYGGDWWTSSMALYSNTLTNNGNGGPGDGYEINNHGRKIEVAGNVLLGDDNVAKFPDAFRAIVHHNLFDGQLLSTTGIKVDRTNDISGLARYVIFWRNVFRVGPPALETFTIDLPGPAESVYLIQNTFDVEDVRVVKHNGGGEAGRACALVDGSAPEETDGTVTWTQPWHEAGSAICDAEGFRNLLFPQPLPAFPPAALAALLAGLAWAGRSRLTR